MYQRILVPVNDSPTSGVGWERILRGRRGAERIPPESDAEQALRTAPVPVLPVRASKVAG